MKKLDIIIINPTENDLGKTVTYESSDSANILKALINNIVYLDISQSKIDYSIGICLSKLQNKVIEKQYYKDNKDIIDIILSIEDALIRLNQTYQDENNVDEFDNELYYIDTLEEVRNKLLFTVTKQIPELADDLLKSISYYSDFIDYYNDSSKE